MTYIVQAPRASNIPESVYCSEQLPCVACSYELSGVPSEAVCPECSLPVWRSRMGSKLAYASSDFRASLRRGTTLVLISTLLLVLVLGGLLGVIIYYEEVLKATPPGLGAPWFFPLAFLVPNLLGFWGYWLFTQPEPGRIAAERVTTWRKTIRIAVAIQAYGILAEIIFASMGFAANFTPGMSSTRLTGAILQLSAFSVVFIAWMAQLLGTVMYARQLSRRLRDEGFETKTRTQPSAIRSWLIGGVGFVLLGPVVFVLFYCRMLWRIRSAIGRIPEPQEHTTSSIG